MFSTRTQVPLLPLALYSYWLSSQLGWPVKFKRKNNCNDSFRCHFYLYQLHVPLVRGPYQGMSRGRSDTIVSFLFRAVLWHSSTRCPAGSSCTTLTALWGSLSVILSPDSLYLQKITHPHVSPRLDLCSALYGSIEQFSAKEFWWRMQWNDSHLLLLLVVAVALYVINVFQTTSGSLACGAVLVLVILRGSCVNLNTVVISSSLVQREITIWRTMGYFSRIYKPTLFLIKEI